MSVVGENIRLIREANGLTQSEFASLLGVKRGRIATYETTESKPDAELANAISQKFDIKIADLFNTRLNIDNVKRVANGSKVPHAAEPSAKYKSAARKFQGDAADTRRPIYNISGTATPDVAIFQDEPEYIEGYIDVPEFGNLKGYIRVFGNSMYPKYCNGDVVACKELKNKRIIPYGEAYLVITEEHRMIKYIDSYDGDETKLTLRSEHHDYKPFVINRDDIITLYAIKGKITRNLI